MKNNFNLTTSNNFININKNRFCYVKSILSKNKEFRDAKLSELDLASSKLNFNNNLNIDIYSYLINFNMQNDFFYFYTIYIGPQQVIDWKNSIKHCQN